MANDEKLPSYACMMLPHELRRVSHPHDERKVTRTGRVRLLVARLARAVRR